MTTLEEKIKALMHKMPEQYLSMEEQGYNAAIDAVLSILEADKPVDAKQLKENAIRYAEWYDNLRAVDYINYRGSTPRELYEAFLKDNNS